MTETARFVAELARREGIEYLQTFADEWAKAVTGLMGDDVTPDRTDNLLVALTRAGKLSPRDMVALAIEHHRELKQRV